MDVKLSVMNVNELLDSVVDLLSSNSLLTNGNLLSLSNDIEIQSVTIINEHQLEVEIQLNVDVDSLIELDVDVEIFSTLLGNLLSSTQHVTLEGNLEETQTIMIDISSIADISLDLFVSVELLNINANVDLRVDSEQLFTLVNGVLDSVFDILSIVNSIESNVDVVQILNVQIENRSIIIDVQLQGNVDIQGGFELDVHVDLLATLGLPMLTRSVHVVFQGDLNEIQTVIIANLPIELAASLEVSLENLHVHVNSDVVVSVGGVFTSTINQLLSKCIFS